MKRPELAELPEYSHKYVALVQGDNLPLLFAESRTTIPPFLEAIPEETWSFRYAEDKWSIKEMVQHLTDTDRIFSYRALCIARGETASLPGFEEAQYAAASKAERRTKADLIQEFRIVQQATSLLFQSFDEDQLDRIGLANNKPISARAIGFITIGHMLHHKNILQEKYGV